MNENRCMILIADWDREVKRRLVNDMMEIVKSSAY